MSFELQLSGRHACFKRYECEALITYDVITPLAARLVFEAVHWTPGIRWEIDEIRVLNPPRSIWVARNELALIASTKAAESVTLDQFGVEQANVLIDVSYLVSAHFVLTPAAGPADSEAQHASMFRRKLNQQRFFRHPYLGLRAFPAEVTESGHLGDEWPTHPALRGAIDLGWMLYDTHVPNLTGPRFFRPTMVDGVIDARRSALHILAR